MTLKPILVPCEVVNTSHTLWVWPVSLLHRRARHCLEAETPAPAQPFLAHSVSDKGLQYSEKKDAGSHLQINHQCAQSPTRDSNKLLTATTVKYLRQLYLLESGLKERLCLQNLVLHVSLVLHNYRKISQNIWSLSTGSRSPEHTRLWRPEASGAGALIDFCHDAVLFSSPWRDRSIAFFAMQFTVGQAVFSFRYLGSTFSPLKGQVLFPFP